MEISETKSIKYLGVIIDSKLNWIEHIRMLKLPWELVLFGKLENC